jgi:hypothetical protein
VAFFCLFFLGGYGGVGLVMTRHKISCTVAVNRSILETNLLSLISINPKCVVDLLPVLVFLNACMMKVYLLLKHIT